MSTREQMIERTVSALEKAELARGRQITPLGEYAAAAVDALAADKMLEALETIAGLAPGYGDVCEHIAKIARAAIKAGRGEAS